MAPLNTQHRTTYFEWHVDSFVVGDHNVEFCDDAFGDRMARNFYDCLIDAWNQLEQQIHRYFARIDATDSV